MRPTEPEGTVRAVQRFMYNWRNLRVIKRAKQDFFHSVANVPVELLREMRVPKPKLLGKLTLVVQVYGALMLVLAFVAMLAWLYLVMV